MNLKLENKVFEGEGVVFTNCTNLIVNKCTFKNTKVVALKCTNPSFTLNSFTNCVDHALQFNACIGGGLIQGNRFEEPVGTSKVSDIINLYKSYGTRAKPIHVENNHLTGGGPSLSGGGIMLGDNMGDWQIAENNICFDTGQYGIAIAGGSNNSILNNTVSNVPHPWSNVGIYVWGVDARQSTVHNPVVRDNHVAWVNKNNKVNDWWKGANVYDLQLVNNIFGKTIGGIRRESESPTVVRTSPLSLLTDV